MLDELRDLATSKPGMTLVTAALIWSCGFGCGVLFLAVVIMWVRAGA